MKNGSVHSLYRTPLDSPGDADYGIVECSYDGARRKDVCTDQLGDTVTFVWDMANRLDKRDYRMRTNSPTGTIADTDSFEYDLARRPTKSISGRYNNVCDFAYDEASRLTSEKLTVDSQSYEITHAYDDDNNLVTSIYPDGSQFTRDWTDRSQLKEVKYDADGVGAGTPVSVVSFLYDAGYRETKRTHGNGIVTNREYDRSDDYVTKIDVKNSSTTAMAGLTFNYTTTGYDANKNVTKETTGGNMADYSWPKTGNSITYDDDRLTDWSRTAGPTNRLEWPELTNEGLSLVGDWRTVKINGTEQSRTHNDAHEVTAVGGNSVSYNAKGNITTNSNSDDYTWDFDNQLKSVDDGTDTFNYTYDALGRRVSKEVGADTTLFVCAGSQVFAEYATGADPSTTAALRKYTYGTYIDDPLMMVRDESGTEAEYYYHTNRLYNVTALTDSNEVVKERYAFTAYGETTILDPDGSTVRTSSTYDNPYMYNGRRLDCFSFERFYQTADV